MKKLWTGLLAMTLTLSLCAATALAAEVQYPNCSGRNCSADGVGRYYVDEDGDGVCDICGRTVSVGAGFLDEDGDGICDNLATGACGGGCGNGTGRQRGHHGGRRS